MTRVGGATSLVSATVNLRTEGRRPEDNLLAGDTIPLAYNVDLVCLWEPDFTTEGSMVMDAQHMVNDVSSSILTMHFR